MFKYAQAVKQKEVWNEAENRDRDWGEWVSFLFSPLRACEARAHATLYRFLYLFWEKKKATLLQSRTQLKRMYMKMSSSKAAPYQSACTSIYCFSFPVIPSPGIHDKTMTFGLTFCKYVSRFIQKGEPTNRKLSCVSSDISLVATRRRWRSKWQFQ